MNLNRKTFHDPRTWVRCSKCGGVWWKGWLADIGSCPDVNHNEICGGAFRKLKWHETAVFYLGGVAAVEGIKP